MSRERVLRVRNEALLWLGQPAHSQALRSLLARHNIPSAALLLQLKTFYPDLRVDAVAGDAGFGFEAYLHTV
jgi:hypothetical protein